MKQIMTHKTIATLGISLITGVFGLNAETFEVDGSKYTTIDENTVELTKYGGDGGVVTLPETITYEGQNYTLTKLGDSAFLYKFSVKQVILPETVTQIGTKCFNASGLESITMSDNVEIIGDYAFYNQADLVSIKNFPTKIKSIGVGAFYGNYGLNEPLFIPAGCSLGDKAFQTCPYITELTLGGEMESIGENALAMGGLQTISINLVTPPAYDPITTFRPGATAEDFAAMTLNVPIGAKAAYQENEKWSIFGTINEIEFPGTGVVVDPAGNVTINVATAGTLGDQLAEADRAKVKSLTLTGDLNGTDFALIRNIPSLETLNLADANIVAGGNYYLKADFGTFYTSDNAVGEYMFYACGVKEVVLPNTATVIQRNAFDSANHLQSVTIGSETKMIDSSAFASCLSLENVNMPNGLDTVSGFAFSGCSSLASITFPETVTEIGDYIFYFCVNLKDVNLSSNLQTIGNHAFFACQSLPEINIPASVIRIDNNAFDRCYKLTHINVDADNSVYASTNGILYDKSLKNLIRYPGGKNEKSFDVPNEVTSIEGYAFYETKLEEVSMTDNVTEIGTGVFTMCDNLRKVRLSDSLTEIPNETFSLSTSVEAVNFPVNLKSIGVEAFMSCSLKEVVLPEGLTHLAEAAFFSNSPLETVILPSTLTTIDNSCFCYDENLKYIYCKALTPPTLNDAESVFEDVERSNIKLYVPQSSLDLYRNAYIWEDFDIEIDRTAVESISNDVNEIYPLKYYDLAGKQINSPLEKGTTVVIMNDGSAKKVIR